MNVAFEAMARQGGPPAGQLERSSSLVLRSHGVFAVLDPQGADITPRRRKGCALLAYLAAHAGADLSRERIAAQLWSDRGEDQARGSLRQCVYELRAVEALQRVLRIGPTRLGLSKEGIRWDFDDLRDAVLDGRVEPLTRWVRSGGQFLEGLDGIDAEFDDWLRGERDRWDQDLHSLVAVAAEAALAGGDVAATRSLCTAFASRDRTDEAVARIGMRADVQAGDVAALRRRYDLLDTALRDELGAVPSTETVALFHGLLETAAPNGATAGRQPRSIDPEDDQASLSTATSQPSRAYPWRPIILVALVVAILGAVAWLLRPDRVAQPTLIAVLPFEPLTRGDEYLADGLWEDTRSALSQNPAFRVLGRTTVKQLVERRLSPRAYGAKLGVAYLLDGSVRRAGDRVRVNVSLVRTDDGLGVWEASFDARLGDALALQQAIAQGIEGRIRGRLAPGGGVRPEQISTFPEVYALFSEARAQLRSREHGDVRHAVDLLQRAVALDPNFAPAWASLGVAMRFASFKSGDAVRMQAQALANVRRSLALAPNLAQAHAGLAPLTGESTPAAEPLLERAVQLDPGNAEAWLWLGNNRATQYRLVEARQAYARAIEIDPLWSPAIANQAMLLGDMGDADGIEKLIDKVARAGAPPGLRAAIGYEAAAARGDYSAALAPLLAVRRKGDDLAGAPLDALADGLVRLGYPDLAARVIGGPEWLGPVLRGDIVPPARFGGRSMSARDFWLHPQFPVVASRAMLGLGRGEDVRHYYHEAFRSPNEAVATMQKVGVLVELAPSVALALRASGDTVDADQLLAAVERQLLAELANAPRHRELLWALGRLRAAQGRHDAALRLLERASAAGWLPDGWFHALDIAREPALAVLAGNPRFETVRRRILGHIVRERAELGSVGLSDIAR